MILRLTALAGYGVTVPPESEFVIERTKPDTFVVLCQRVSMSLEPTPTGEGKCRLAVSNADAKVTRYRIRLATTMSTFQFGHSTGPSMVSL